MHECASSHVHVHVRARVQARRAEGWWRASPTAVSGAPRTSALLCHAAPLLLAPAAAAGRGAAMLQYGACVVGSSLVVTLWQEPQHGCLLAEPSVGAVGLFTRLVRWLAQCDGHLAGATAAMFTLLKTEQGAAGGGGGGGGGAGRGGGGGGGRRGQLTLQPLPHELALPVQHLLPHGRYFSWQLRTFEPPMRR